jgi:uncharacterized protein (TIGR03437 family)
LGRQFSMIALLFAGGAAAQMPQLNNASLSGRFHFVYGVYQRSQAQTTMGTLSFDGQGHYTAVAGSVIAQGLYRVDSDGTGNLSNPFDPLQPPLNLRLSAGSTMIGGSTLEQSIADRHDLLLAISAGSQPRSMKGNWGGITFLYTPGPPLLARAGRFRFVFDATGNASSTSWTYHQSDLDNGAPHDLTSTGTYTVDGSGIGTYTSAQGAKRIAVSADGNTYIGTDSGGAPEMIFATRLADTTANSAGLQGRYWWLSVAAVAPGGANLRGSDFTWAIGNGLQGFEARGLNRASGWAQFIDGPTGRLLDMAAMLGPFSVNADSTVDLTFGGLGSAGIGVISASNGVLPWTNLTPTATVNYSFSIALRGPWFQATPGQRVFLDPNGPIQAATASSHPFPFAPGTLITVRGAGLAIDAQGATGTPLPTILGSTSLMANGQPVGLMRVAPDSITFVMPWATAGAGRIRLKAIVGGSDSNEIVVRAAPASPGFFSTTADGLGMVLGTHADGSLITADSPTAPGEVVVLYASGLGALATSVAEYSTAASANVTSVPVQVDVAGVQAEIRYAGAAPALPGVYQINIVIPQSAATSPGANVRIFQGYTQTHPKVVIPIRAVSPGGK